MTMRDTTRRERALTNTAREVAYVRRNGRMSSGHVRNAFTYTARIEHRPTRLATFADVFTRLVSAGACPHKVARVATRNGSIDFPETPIEIGNAFAESLTRWTRGIEARDAGCFR